MDDSPDTTGASVVGTSFGNQYAPSLPGYGFQIVGGQFTLADDASITGASIFSRAGFGQVGDLVWVLIFSDPLSAPIEKFTVTLDAADTLYTTTQTGLTRKHASFDEVDLVAGTYWIAMSADIGTGDILQATGAFGDGIARMGETVLSNSYTDQGKPFMQVEGTAVPEPATWVLIGLGGGLILWRGRKRQ